MFFLLAFSFNKVPICTFARNIWMVSDRYDYLHDFDGNGLPDMPLITRTYPSNYGYPYIVFQDSLGFFSCVRVSSQRASYSLSSGDLNDDGLYDMIYIGSGVLNFLLNNGDRTFTLSTASFGSSINHLAIRDTDTGAVIFATDESGGLYMYDYISSSSTRLNGTCREGLSVEDLDGDGWYDVVCGSSNWVSSGHIYYQLNTGSGWSSLVRITTFSACYHGIKAVDINADGMLDVVSCAGSTVYVWYNEGGSPLSFHERSYATGSSSRCNTCEVTVADFDCDGDGDILWSAGLNGGSPSVVLLENDGSLPYPNFVSHTVEPSSYTNYGVAAGLVNDDDLPDVVAGLGRTLYVFYNTTPAADSSCNPFGGGDELKTEEFVVQNGFLTFHEEREFAVYSVDGRLLMRGRGRTVKLPRGVLFIKFGQGARMVISP
ncbi:MAG: VCBS repeat-containing protein [Thermotogae bacterium]|nr:VCBS repeat-containing protein [Thermotogota bacterium]